MRILDWARKLRRSYRLLFWGDDGEIKKEYTYALNDLRRFCYADKSCLFVNKHNEVDPLKTAALEGRREVWMYLSQILNLTDDQLNLIYLNQLQEEQNARNRNSP